MTSFIQDHYAFDICPNCEAIFPDNIYASNDVITGNKIYRCKRCHVELTKSNIGWVLK